MLLETLKPTATTAQDMNHEMLRLGDRSFAEGVNAAIVDFAEAGFR